MLRLIGRWLLRAAVALVLLFAAVYLGDMAIYKLRGSPQSKVSVNRYVTVPLKGNKTEFDYQGTLDVPCSLSIFPQGDETPCWKLRKNPNQNTAM
ncbi:MAG: hypothetical protein WBF42_12850 [Terracidiphilus sp.]